MRNQIEKSPFIILLLFTILSICNPITYNFTYFITPILSYFSYFPSAQILYTDKGMESTSFSSENYFSFLYVFCFPINLSSVPSVLLHWLNVDTKLTEGRSNYQKELDRIFFPNILTSFFSFHSRSFGINHFLFSCRYWYRTQNIPTISYKFWRKTRCLKYSAFVSFSTHNNSLILCSFSSRCTLSLTCNSSDNIWNSASRLDGDYVSKLNFIPCCYLQELSYTPLKFELFWTKSSSFDKLSCQDLRNLIKTRKKLLGKRMKQHQSQKEREDRESKFQNMTVTKRRSILEEGIFHDFYQTNMNELSVKRAYR